MFAFDDVVFKKKLSAWLDHDISRMTDAVGYRWGNEAGYCVVDGQKVPIERIRLRSKDGRELPLGSYQLFQRSVPLEDACGGR